ncbi:MAG: tRNA (cytidine(56)-2'-O)-methyltransferase [Nitrososphaerota archaeon]
MRLGHRIERDKRLTTHVGLTARAFGACHMYYSGEMDKTVSGSLTRVADMWGGSFGVSYIGDWRSFLQKWRETGGLVVHLTMYGLPLKNVIGELRGMWRDRKTLVVVGGEKVQPEIFQLAHYNVSVTTQPHSEVAALAVFLDWLQQGDELDKEYQEARMRVMPSPRGKRVITTTD